MPIPATDRQHGLSGARGRPRHASKYQGDRFLRITAGDEIGEIVEVDLSLFWRERPGGDRDRHVLIIQDAAAAKVATICSRGEPCDFIDPWSIRRSKLWSDAELFAMAKEPGRRYGG